MLSGVLTRKAALWSLKDEIGSVEKHKYVIYTHH